MCSTYATSGFEPTQIPLARNSTLPLLLLVLDGATTAAVDVFIQSAPQYDGTGVGEINYYHRRSYFREEEG